MFKFRHLLPVLTFAVAPLLWADEAPLSRWQTDIAQGYDALATGTTQLREASQRFCKAGSDGTRVSVEQAWRKSFLDWQAIRFVDFGPIEQNSRAWQIQFWPDSKNLVARKVKSAISSDTSNAISVEDAGVALQGFPAIEYLLFDVQMNKSEQALPSREACRLLIEITEHLEHTTEALAEDWSRFSPHYIATPSYRAKTVETGMNALEILRDRRLADPMGLRGTPKKNPYSGDAWRSDYSLAAVRASIEGMNRYFAPGLAIFLTQQGEAALAKRLKEQFKATTNKLDALPDSLAASLKDQEGYRELQSLFITVTQLQQLMTDQVAPALNITRGFNSNDGD